MYFDKPGSDLLCATAARRCTLPFPTGDFLTRPSNYITPAWYLVSHHAFELEEPSAGGGGRDREGDGVVLLAANIPFKSRPQVGSIVHEIIPSYDACSSKWNQSAA